MTDFQKLDARFNNVLELFVGQCTSVPIPDIMNTLGIADAASAVNTFKKWGENRGLMAVQLTIEMMMVGRHLV